MATRRKKRDDLGLIKPAIVLTGVGIGLGVGSSVVGSVGGSTAAAAQGGLTSAASFLPVAGTVVGSFVVVRQLQGLQRQVEVQTKQRKRRR